MLSAVLPIELNQLCVLTCEHDVAEVGLEFVGLRFHPSVCRDLHSEYSSSHRYEHDGNSMHGSNHIEPYLFQESEDNGAQLGTPFFAVVKSWNLETTNCALEMW